MNKEYQKPEMTIKALVAETELANEGGELIFSTNTDGWFDWD